MWAAESGGGTRTEVAAQDRHGGTTQRGNRRRDHQPADARGVVAEEHRAALARHLYPALRARGARAALAGDGMPSLLMGK